MLAHLSICARRVDSFGWVVYMGGKSCSRGKTKGRVCAIRGRWKQRRSEKRPPGVGSEGVQSIERDAWAGGGTELRPGPLRNSAPPRRDWASRKQAARGLVLCRV